MKKYLACCAIFIMGCGGSSSSNTTSTTPASTTTKSSNLASSSQSKSSVSTGHWSLVWSDEFDGTLVDAAKWSFERNCRGGYNNELQCYTDRIENAFLSNGLLHIVAKKEIFHGQAKQDDVSDYDPADTSATREYTSARLRTKTKGDWIYGRMEIRAKLPQGQGVWPAIWMLPSEAKYGGWPEGGEIDIMEAINSNTPNEGNKIYGTLHYGAPLTSKGTYIIPEKNIWEEFHTYTIEWEQGEIRWYVDRKHYMTQTQNEWFTSGSANKSAPFDQAFHLILNFAVGGNWPKSPNEKTLFPQEMIVDFVRVYQCSADSLTGKGCASDVDSSIKPLPETPR